MSSLIAVLDSCVLYPPSVRDLLLSITHGGYFQPKWSKTINDEWTRNFLANRPEVEQSTLTAIVETMDNAFPDANIQSYKTQMKGLSLPVPRLWLASDAFSVFLS